jgi:hypothetical protein
VVGRAALLGMRDLGSYKLMVRDKIRVELNGVQWTMGSMSLLRHDLGAR